MTLFFAANCNFAQAQIAQASPDVKILETLPDGSIVIAIDGVKYRAISADQIRQIQEIKINASACQEEKSALSAKIETLKTELQTANQQTAIADAQTKDEHARAEEFKGLFEKERELRQASEKIKTPRKPNHVIQILSQPILVGAVIVVFKKIIGGR